MPEPIAVYNLGELGVNLSKSPVHVDDGELVQAQNAEFFREQGRGALRKRPALRRYNSDVLAGTIGGAIGVPLAGPGRRGVYAQRPGTPWFRKSTNGTTWADDNGFTSSPLAEGIAYSIYPLMRAAICSRQFFFSTSSAVLSYGVIWGFDGETQYELARFEGALNLRTLCQHNDQVVFAGGVAGGTVAVFIADPATGNITQVGASLSYPEEVMCGVSYQGRIWIGTATAVEGKLYSAAPNSTTWKTERTAAAGHKMYSTLAVRQGELFAGTGITVAGTAAIVEKRTAAGVWSTSQTGGSTTVRNWYDGLIVWNGDLYAAYQAPNHGGGATPIIIIEKFNGSAWSTDKDLDSETPAETGIHGVVAVGTSLYYNAFNGTRSAVWRKVGSTWTRVDTTVGTATTGVMGVI